MRRDRVPFPRFNVADSSENEQGTHYRLFRRVGTADRLVFSVFFPESGEMPRYSACD